MCYSYLQYSVQACSLGAIGCPIQPRFHRGEKPCLDMRHPVPFLCSLRCHPGTCQQADCGARGAQGSLHHPLFLGQSASRLAHPRDGVLKGQQHTQKQLASRLKAGPGLAPSAPSVVSMYMQGVGGEPWYLASASRWVGLTTCAGPRVGRSLT